MQQTLTVTHHFYTTLSVSHRESRWLLKKWNHIFRLPLLTELYLKLIWNSYNCKTLPSPSLSVLYSSLILLSVFLDMQACPVLKLVGLLFFPFWNILDIRSILCTVITTIHSWLLKINNPNSEAKWTQNCKVSIPDRGVKTVTHHRLQETRMNGWALPLRNLHVTQKKSVPSTLGSR